MYTIQSIDFLKSKTIRQQTRKTEINVSQCFFLSNISYCLGTDADRRVTIGGLGPVVGHNVDGCLFGKCLFDILTVRDYVCRNFVRRHYVLQPVLVVGQDKISNRRDVDKKEKKNL